MRIIDKPTLKNLMYHAAELSYYLRDEKKHFEESGKPHDHIYHSVMEVEEITDKYFDKI